MRTLAQSVRENKAPSTKRYRRPPPSYYKTRPLTAAEEDTRFLIPPLTLAECIEIAGGDRGVGVLVQTIAREYTLEQQAHSTIWTHPPDFHACWVQRTRAEWMKASGLTLRRYKRAIADAQHLKLMVVEYHLSDRYDMNRTTYMRLEPSIFLPAMEKVLAKRKTAVSPLPGSKRCPWIIVSTDTTDHSVSKKYDLRSGDKERHQNEEKNTRRTQDKKGTGNEQTHEPHYNQR